MSFFAGLAQGLGNGLSIGQSIKSGQEERERRRRIGELAPGIISGDKGALADYSKIVGPNNALATGSGVMAMQQQQRQQQLQGIATGLAYFGDVKTPEQFEARKAAFAKTPFAELLPPDQLTWENFPQLKNMAVATVQSVKSPDEIAMIKSTAQQAAMERDKAEIGLRDAANARIGAARGSVQGQQPGGTASPYNPDAKWQPGGDNVGYAYDYLKRKGLPEHVVAGLVGNLIQESGPNLNPEAVGDNGAAFGAGQWNGPRKRALQEFAERYNANPADLDVQLEFMLHEAKTSEKGAFDKIMRAETPEEAARIASEAYWRPGDPRMNNRIRNAREVAQRFDGRDNGAEATRDALNESNPALGRYAPQGQISDAAGAMMRPPQARDDEFNQRADRIRSLGIDPNSPQGQEYLLTGKLPDAASRKPYTDMGKLNTDHANGLLTDDQYLEAYGRMQSEANAKASGQGGKVTDGQRKVEMFRQRGVAALERMRSMIDKGYSGMSMVEQNVGSNYVLDEDDQLFNQALNSAVEAMLRLDSGATVTEADIRSKMDLYEWRYSDSEAVKRQKWQQLQDDFESARIAAGNAASPDPMEEMTDEELIQALEASNG